MTEKHYISVILPLKLEWEPCYWTSENVEKGDRVRVNFAGKEYIGVVRSTDAAPEIHAKRIREIVFVEREMEKILPEEIELWERVAEYYMCSVGDAQEGQSPLDKDCHNDVQTRVISHRTHSDRLLCDGDSRKFHRWFRTRL